MGKQRDAIVHELETQIKNATDAQKSYEAELKAFWVTQPPIINIPNKEHAPIQFELRPWYIVMIDWALIEGEGMYLLSVATGDKGPILSNVPIYDVTNPNDAVIAALGMLLKRLLNFLEDMCWSPSWGLMQKQDTTEPQDVGPIAMGMRLWAYDLIMQNVRLLHKDGILKSSEGGAKNILNMIQNLKKLEKSSDPVEENPEANVPVDPDYTYCKNYSKTVEIRGKCISRMIKQGYTFVASRYVPGEGGLVTIFKKKKSDIAREDSIKSPSAKSKGTKKGA